MYWAMSARALPCRVDRAVHALVLQCGKERFGHCIIITYPGSTDRLPDSMLDEGRGEASRGMFTAPIGVEDAVAGEGQVAGSHANGLDYKRRLVVVVHRVADAFLG